MVGKLLKHELIALFRVLGFIAVAVFGFAVLGRIVIAINSETVFGFLLILFYLFAIMTLIVAAFVLGISQFYKSLFTGSGYMTLSLPATADQIIWAKLLSSVIAMFFASAVSLLSATVFLVGIPSEFWAEFWASIQPLLDTMFSYLSSEPLIIVELVVQFIVQIPFTLLFFYCVLAVGQLFTSHRKPITFLILIGVNFVASLLNSLCLTPIENACVEVSPHLAIWVDIILYAALDVTFYFVVRYIIRNKVNLIV